MRNPTCRAMSALLSLLLALPGMSWAQQPQETPAAAPAAQAPPPASIKLMVVQGEGAINNIEKRVVTEPIVEVRDQENRPVAGAEVVFTTPPSGPGATFFGASRTYTVKSDENGRARGTGLSPNVEEGTYPIDVTATMGNLQTSVSITQTNARAPELKTDKKNGIGWRLLTAIAAGAAAGIVAVSRRDGNSGTSTPTSISVGGVSVGAPR
jgi:hypothetical protein